MIYCMYCCKNVCGTFSCLPECEKEDAPFPQPPPPPPPPLLDGHERVLSSTLTTILACTIGGAFLFAVICFLLKWFYLKRNSRRTNTSPSILLHTQSDFMDEEQGGGVFHPIWYINSVGLEQSIIDSIAVCKYRKDEGLIEGRDCSVCLGEFEEDDCVRLLPKCSHAFHLPCIDTWLRSHKNCPLCRAPVVNEMTALSAVSVAESSSNDSSHSSEETEVENLQLSGEEDVRGVEENIENRLSSLPIEEGLAYFNERKCKSRAQSDLAENHSELKGEEMQPMRRSVSMDSSSAAMIFKDLARAQLVTRNNTSLKIGWKQRNGSPSLYRPMKNSSIRMSLQKGPFLMKRSFSSSSSGKLLSSRRSKSQESVLPL